MTLGYVLSREGKIMGVGQTLEEARRAADFNSWMEAGLHPVKYERGLWEQDRCTPAFLAEYDPGEAWLARRQPDGVWLFMSKAEILVAREAEAIAAAIGDKGKAGSGSRRL